MEKNWGNFDEEMFLKKFTLIGQQSLPLSEENVASKGDLPAVIW